MGLPAASQEKYLTVTATLPGAQIQDRQHTRQGFDHHGYGVPDVARWLNVGILLLCLCFCASAQIVTVNALLTDGGGNQVPTGFLHFELENCGNNFPTLGLNPGLSQNPWTVVKTAFDLAPNQPDGSIIGQVIGNDLILCGNVASTYYQVTAMKDANTPLSPVGGQPYMICSATAPGTLPCSNPGTGEWDPALQQPSFQPVAPGFVQLFQNPIVSQIWNQPTGTDGKLIGAFDCTLATFITIYGTGPCGFGSGGGGSGGGPNQEVTFTNAVTATLTVANTTPYIVPACYDSSGNGIPFGIHISSSYVVTFGFGGASVSGTCVINNSTGQGTGTSTGNLNPFVTFTNATSTALAIPNSSPYVVGYCYDQNWNGIPFEVKIASATATFSFGGVLQSGFCVVNDSSSGSGGGSSTPQLQGTCSMTSGACTLVTFATPFNSTPSCQVNWTGSGVLTGILSSNRVTSSIQPKSSIGSDTAQVDWSCFGNPN